MVESKKGLKKLMEERLRKLKEFRQLCIDVYPHSFKRKHTTEQLRKRFNKLKKGQITKSRAVVAGRIKAIRIMGKASFLDIKDGTGRIQLYFHKNTLKEKYKLLKKLDVGDFLGCSGFIFKTKTGELTIHVQSFVILAKAIRPLPSEWYGLRDAELRYRHRELDMLMNPEIKKIFITRSKALTLMREFLNKKGYLEVETPLLQPIYGGGHAKPFITHLNALDMRLYLSISPELYLKRLIIGGFEKVYTISKNFRNEGIDRSHNPEFTMMECYAAYHDYNDMMVLVEELYEFIFKKILGTTKLKYEGNILDFKRPWKRLTMYDAIKKHLGINVEKLNKEEIIAETKKKGLKLDYKDNWTKGVVVIELFEEYVANKIIQPTFITDHPKESTPLCKLHRSNPELIERFEPLAAGYELGNAYTELNDPLLQRKLFKEQVKKRQLGDEEAHPFDENFLEALELGMPPTGGLGLGFDRMVMLLTGQHSIREVIIFPFMKETTEE